MISSGGTVGSALVLPPGGAAPYAWPAPGSGEAWAYARIPATPGTWVLAAAPGGDAGGFAYVRAVAVKWIASSIS